MPDDVSERDFHPFTCGISKFVRRTRVTPVRLGSGTRGEQLLDLEEEEDEEEGNKMWEPGIPFPTLDWRDGKGIAGGWDCVLNGDCTHLDAGPERGWWVSPL